MPNEIRIQHKQLIAVISETLAGVRVPSPVRDVEAEVMAEADLLGVPSHGVRMLPGLVQGIREGRANPNPPLEILRERAAVCVLDGGNGPGRFVSTRAMQAAVDRAKGYGVGVCLATRVTHWGRAHAYAYRAALAGMIGVCTTNAIPNMLGWNSTRPVLANNPLAIGIPRGDHQDPIILDMAMSQAAVGKIGTYLREGKKIPTNWGLDDAGQPTDDAAAILANRRLVPFGDHKGAGLALMMELLTGALAGGMLSYQVGQQDSSGLDPNSSKFFLALDLESFIDRERFAQRVQDLLAYIESAEPGLAITYPGERGWETRDRYLAEGIPIHADIAAQLKAIGVIL
ncbi:MAG TPA: Ldh family oxidoreductase [Anaerolineae bacterium]